MASQNRRDLAQKLMESLLEEKNAAKSSEPTSDHDTKSGVSPSLTSNLPNFSSTVVQKSLPAPKAQPKPASTPEDTIPVVNIATSVAATPAAPHHPVGSPHLVQAEHLRLAQQRILDLEKEVERVRKENDELSAAADAIKLSLDSIRASHQNLQNDSKENRRIFEEEMKIYKSSMSAREVENQNLKQKVQELTLRIENDFKRIRVRERELEHRLELMRLENAAVIRSKDELILDLKRRIDQLGMEADNVRNRYQSLNESLEEKNETLRQVVRALRLALTSVEGSDETSPPLKKVD